MVGAVDAFSGQQEYLLLDNYFCKEKGQTLNVARQREALLCIMHSFNICTTLILALLLIGIKKLAH